MPHLRLNIYNAQGDALDPEGADFPDIAAARHAGLEGIRSFLSAEVLEGELNLDGHLEIVDDYGKMVATIAFSEAVKITGQ